VGAVPERQEGRGIGVKAKAGSCYMLFMCWVSAVGYSMQFQSANSH
jgi:hypothetical protein